MDRKNVSYPFEVSVGELRKHTDVYVDSIFSCLESEFLVLPRGPGFVDYAMFENGYEALKRATQGFSVITVEKTLPVVQATPIAFIVLRSMLGFTPPELAYVATQRTGIKISQSAARTLNRKARMTPDGQDLVAVEGALVPVAFKTLMSIRNASTENASFLILKTPNPSEMTL